MSCHTWTYKKFKACDEHTRFRYLEKCNKEVAEYADMKFSEFKKEHEKICDAYIKHAKAQHDEEEAKSWEEYKSPESTWNCFQEQVVPYRDFKGGVDDGNVTAFAEKFDDSSKTHIINGELYLNIDFDVPFRLYGYPEETFTDKAKLLEFLSTKGERVGYYFGNSFHGGYTDELVDAINKYFEEHGEGNLYFEFG